jgi:predicted NBD/HSP70 family sugar kinase
LTPIAATQRQREILRLIRVRGAVTRRDLARQTGLSASQVSRLAVELISAGLVEADDIVAATFGRPPDLLRLAGGNWFVVGMEVGGGAVRAVLANLRGEPCCRLQEPIPDVSSREAAFEAFSLCIDRLIAASGVTREQVLGLGIGLYAVVDPVAGVVVDWSEHPGWSGWWRDFGLRQALADRFACQTVVVDDAVRMRAVAEAVVRRESPVSDFLFVLADSGIGAAFFTRGQPYLGPQRLAGEIGHVVVDPAGPLCPCGRRGCLEAVASLKAVERLAGADALQLALQPGQGDPATRNLLAEAGACLGMVLAPIVSLIFPPLIIIGGRLAAADCYIAAMSTALAETAHPRAVSALRIDRALAGADGGETGAVAAVLDRLFAADIPMQPGLSGASQQQEGFSHETGTIERSRLRRAPG